MREEIVEKIREIAERIGEQESIEIVDVQLLGGGASRLLRLTIDCEGGVTHTHCETITHKVGDVLDAEDIIPGEGYQLEVTSPGVERPLKQPKDFTRFAGKKIKVVLKEAIGNSKRFEGLLHGLQDGNVELETAKGGRVSVPLEKIQKANLKFEW